MQCKTQTKWIGKLYPRCNITVEHTIPWWQNFTSGCSITIQVIDSSIQFFKESVINILLRIIRHFFWNSKIQIRNRAIGICHTMHCRYFQNLCHRKPGIFVIVNRFSYFTPGIHSRQVIGSEHITIPTSFIPIVTTGRIDTGSRKTKIADITISTHHFHSLISVRTDIKSRLCYHQYVLLHL